MTARSSRTNAGPAGGASPAFCDHDPAWHDRRPMGVAVALILVSCFSIALVSFGARPASTLPPPDPALLDLNAASQAELELLPNVGPNRARDIVELRTRLGGFRRLSQLERVHGIGPKTVEGITPYVTLE